MIPVSFHEIQLPLHDGDVWINKLKIEDHEIEVPIMLRRGDRLMVKIEHCRAGRLEIQINLETL